VAKQHDLVSIENLPRAVRGQVAARTAVNCLADFASLVIGPIPLLAGKRALPDQLLLKFGGGHEHVKQEPGCRIGFVRVDILACGDEPHTMGLELLQRCFAIHQRSSKPIEFPAEHYIKAPLPHVQH
jgi:hypothetical protein